MGMAQELAWAARRLARRPVSAAGIALTLALGIGIPVGMFSILHGVVLKSLPYPSGHDIVVIHSRNPESGVARGLLTPAEAVEGLVVVPGFERTAYFHWGGLTYIADGAPRNITSLHVSADYFAVFGIAPALGRMLGPEDVRQRHDAIVLSHAAWLNLTGGDPGAIGRLIPFKDEQFELVGVLPETFAHPGSGSLIYRAIDVDQLTQNVPVYLNARYLNAIGRLLPDAEPALAIAGLDATLAAVGESHALPAGGWRFAYTRLIDETIGGVRNVLFALFAVALLVLLIACANAASLVSIRLEQRERDLAVRRALGASKARVALGTGLELCLLASFAAVAGVLLARAMIGMLQPLAAGNLPRADDISISVAVLGFAAAATLASVLLSGAVPMWRAVRAGPAATLRGATSPMAGRARQVAWLPVAGITLSTIALIAALALAASLVRLAGVDPGFRTEGITALQLFRPTSEEAPRFVVHATEALESIPGVRQVAAVSAPPLSVVGRFHVDVAVHGRDDVAPIQALARRASAGYHHFFGVAMRRGRDLATYDTLGAPNVVVINETLARQVFGSGEPLGQVLLLPFGDGDRIPFEVVGVAADVRNAGLRAPAEPELVVSLEQQPWAGITLLVDSSIAPPNWARTLQEAIWALDGKQAFFRTFTLDAELEAQLRDARLFATATGWFAVFALLLAAAGVNAVVAAMQRRRTREIGMRMALGARPGHAARLMFGSAVRMVGLGLVAGGMLAYPALGWLQGQLFGLGSDPFWSLFGLTAAVLLAAGLVATCWPAWRAARVAPMDALRHE